MTDKEKFQSSIFFPIGEPNPYGQFFVGQSYLAPLTLEQVPTYNVTFEPGCRNNWHVHHAKSGGGQMLICVGGRGYYQEWGKEAVEMTPGTVINIPAEVKHWHGAASDSWFSHLAFEIPGEEGSNEWYAKKVVSSADVAILDPPRAGCDEKLLEAVCKVSPERIVYVSCDPATLARDIKYLTANGYEFIKAAPVDMFPHTGHVETVVLMSRVN